MDAGKTPARRLKSFLGERGEEDSTSFLRKGVAGDWSNVFTARNREIFKEHAGDLLIRLGYERDHDW